MINFFKKFKYKTISTVKYSVNWNSGWPSIMSIIFQENGFGKRKIITEGNIWPAQIENEPYWNEHVIPWLYNSSPRKESTSEVYMGDNIIPFVRK